MMNDLKNKNLNCNNKYDVMNLYNTTLTVTDRRRFHLLDKTKRKEWIIHQNEVYALFIFIE